MANKTRRLCMYCGHGLGPIQSIIQCQYWTEKAQIKSTDSTGTPIDAYGLLLVTTGATCTCPMWEEK